MSNFLCEDFHKQIKYKKTAQFSPKLPVLGSTQNNFWVDLTDSLPLLMELFQIMSNFLTGFSHMQERSCTSKPISSSFHQCAD